jgi:sugar O-acyltransferase (sialic acid O-acetyltransferase NeuD family)
MILGIYGSGGLGREIFEIALRRNSVSSLWSQIIFIDDFSDEGDFFGTKRIHFDTFFKIKSECECVIALGEPSSREKLFERLVEAKIKLTCLIDPTAIISPSALIHDGVIICEYATIHTGVVLGCNVLIQPFCDIGHDIKVGNHSVLSSYCVPGGGTVFGARVFVGLHAAIKESLTIGDDAVLGMGSVVFRDVSAGTTVLGNPARVTKGNDDHKVFKSVGTQKIIDI